MLALSVKTYYYIINALCKDRLHGMNKSAQKMVRKGAFFAMTERNLTMLTDFYEFTMANGYFEKGIGNRRAYFDMFFRRVPDGGGYAIMAGVEQLIEYFNNLHFSEEAEALRCCADGQNNVILSIASSLLLNIKTSEDDRCK